MRDDDRLAPPGVFFETERMTQLYEWLVDGKRPNPDMKRPNAPGTWGHEDASRQAVDVVDVGGGDYDDGGEVGPECKRCSQTAVPGNYGFCRTCRNNGLWAATAADDVSAQPCRH